MKDITIFSTRLFGKNYLFSEESIFAPPIEVQNELDTYFGIEKKETDDILGIWWQVLEKNGRLQEVEEAIKNAFQNPPLSDFQKRNIKRAFERSKHPDKYELKEVEDCKKTIYEYMEKIEGGATAFLSRYVNSIELSGQNIQKDLTVLYKACDDVYAIHLLEGSDVDDDGQKGWIKTLIQCAKSFADKDDKINLRLVLHDCDLGRKYAENDVTILCEKDVKALAQDKFNELESLKIVFFRHTSNAFAIDILGKPFYADRNVHQEVDYWINILQEDYPERLEEIDGAPYGNNPKVALEDSYNKLINTINKKV